MKAHMKRLTLFLIAFCFYSLSVKGQTTDSEDNTTPKKWNFLGEVYFLFPYMSGDTGIGNLPNVQIDANPGDILSQLSMGAMFYFEADIDKWAFSSDFIYMNLGKGLDAEPSAIINFGTIELKQLMWELAAFRKLLPYLDAGLGLRLNSLDINSDINRMTINGPETIIRGDSKTWVDPFIVARFHDQGDSKFLYQLRADIGGFGIGSDLAWQIQAYLGYRFSDLIQASAGYRLISIDYDKGSGSDRFLYDVDTSGPVIRLGFNF